MTRRSPPSLSTPLLLTVLAAILPVLALIACGKTGIFFLGLATMLTLVIAWFGCQQAVLKPLTAMVKAAQQADRLGVGLAGMQERLQHLVGRMNVHSDPQGTTVCATLPRRGMLS